ncbi:hypothetical protein TNCV_4499321 [Trichonephila clavipes]|nr:hypothetical protein TNCV_4499321 [Trichonephila clavipes]
MSKVLLESSWASSSEEFGVRVTLLSVEDLIARLYVAAERICDMPGIFQNVWNSMQHRCQACQTTSDRNLEHFL